MRTRTLILAIMLALGTLTTAMPSDAQTVTSTEPAWISSWTPTYRPKTATILDMPTVPPPTTMRRATTVTLPTYPTAIEPPLWDASYEQNLQAWLAAREARRTQEAVVDALRDIEWQLRQMRMDTPYVPWSPVLMSPYFHGPLYSTPPYPLIR